MEIQVRKEVTGIRQETFYGTHAVQDNFVIDYTMEDGRDIRSVDPEGAQKIETEAIRSVKSTIIAKVMAEIISLLTKEAKDGVVVTPLVEKSLTLISPKEQEKLQKKEVDKKRPKRTPKE